MLWVVEGLGVLLGAEAGGMGGWGGAGGKVGMGGLRSEEVVGTTGCLRAGWGAPKGCLLPKTETNYLPLPHAVRVVGF